VHLAEKILTSKAALEGECKQVTVLFADIKGFLELLADRDPEEARQLLNPVLERMMDAVPRYEGTVNQVMGDGIMALFGAPIAHEGHAIRACYAVLAMQAAVIGTEVTLPLLQAITDLPEALLQVGLGHLQAAEFLYEMRLFPEREYTFTHALTHQVAYESLIQERRRVLHARIVEALEYFAPDHLAEQVERLTHHALQGEVWGRGLAYGRQAGEKAIAWSAYREAIASFAQAPRALPHLTESRETRVHALDLRLRLADYLTHGDSSDAEGAERHYRQALALANEFGMHPLQAHCHRGLGSLGAKIDRWEPARAELTAAIARYGVIDMAFWLPPAEAALAQQKQQTLQALLTILLRIAAQQPVLFVMEDLHWGDPSTLELLRLFIDQAPTAPLLHLLTFRPEFVPPWPPARM